MQDLSGPKIRTGRLAGGQPLPLREGDHLDDRHRRLRGRGRPRLDRLRRAGARRAAPAIGCCSTTAGSSWRSRAATASRSARAWSTAALLGEHKGINAPRVALPSGALTLKDAEDLAFGLSLGVDLVALSFVQSAADVHAARAVAVVARRARRAAGRQARTARGDRPARRDPRRRRRGDGGARRPRPRGAVRPRAARPEGRAARGPGPRRAGHRRHPGARVDARGAAADARRGQRRGQRRRPGRLRDHAGRRDRGGEVPGAGRRRRSTPSSATPRPTASTRPSRCRASSPATAVGARGRAGRRRGGAGDAGPRRRDRRRDPRRPDGADAVVGPARRPPSTPPPIGPRWRAAWRCGGACRRW